MGMVGQIESIYGFPGSSVGKESACNTGDPGSIPGSGRSSGEGIGYPLQCSGTSLVAQLVKNRLQCRRPGFDPWVRKIPWRGKVYPFQYFGLENSMDCISPWGLKESHTTERLSLSCLEINFFLSSSSGTPMIQMLGRLTLSQRSLRLSSFLLILFLFCSLLHLFPPFCLPPHLIYLLP